MSLHTLSASAKLSPSRVFAGESLRQRNRGGTLIVSGVTTQLIEQLGGSIAIIGEPQQPNTPVFPDQLPQELPVSYGSRFKISNG